VARVQAREGRGEKDEGRREGSHFCDVKDGTD